MLALKRCRFSCRTSLDKTCIDLLVFSASFAELQWEVEEDREIETLEHQKDQSSWDEELQCANRKIPEQFVFACSF